MRKLNNNELERISIKQFKKSKKTAITIVLDNIRSAFNVGAVFRCADAFIIEKIILCGITATPPNKEIRKSALGSSHSVNWEYSKNTIDAITQLKKEGQYIIGIEQTTGSTLLQEFKTPKKPITIIMGNEVHGISQEIVSNCDEIIEIPQFGTKHSLNISTATGIVIWELFRKLQNN